MSNLFNLYPGIDEIENARSHIFGTSPNGSFLHMRWWNIFWAICKRYGYRGEYFNV